MRSEASQLLEEWQLVADGVPMPDSRSLVLPVRTPGGAPAVLKIGLPHPEAAHESLALQHWHGNGAVRLLRAVPHRFALLLERLQPEDLTDVWDVEACEIVAGLYARLHRPAPPQLRSLTSYAEAWARDLAALPRSAPLPRRMVEQAAAIARSFASDAATDGRMIHGDLHYGHVLAADREPWLVIGPKPLSGDPHYEVAPLLFHRFDELAAPDSVQSVRDGVRRRFHTVIDVAGLDEDRARDWVVLRLVCNAMQGLEDLTMCVAIVKAVQD